MAFKLTRTEAIGLAILVTVLAQIFGLIWLVGLVMGG